MSNRNYIHAQIALISFLFLGFTSCVSESVIDEYENRAETPANSIPNRKDPTDVAPSDEKGDTIKITVEFDKEWKDTISVTFPNE